jgi:hypothetical protein
MRVPQAIADNYPYNPTRPLNVAGAMGMSPTSGPFRMITGAALAYGLITGAARAPEIGLTPLALRIVRPTVEGDDAAAKREALLKPRIIGDFLRQYDGAALPSDAIARNVLEQSGVPGDRTESVLELILEGAKAVGFIREWNGKRFVDLTAANATTESAVVEEAGGAVPASTQPAATPVVQAAGPAVQPTVSVGAGVHINIEIHIAADASSQTVEDIFKNMRRYVLKPDSDGDAE